MDERTGKIGEHKGTSYYLLYTSDGKKDRALDFEWLTGVDKAEKNRRIVVYCEKIWVHRDDLAKYEAETKRTVRPMLVPFGLKEEGPMPKTSYTAILEKEGDLYVALCPELDVASQGGTVEEATANLKEAVELFLESADPREIKRRLHSEVFVTRFDAAHG